MRSSSSSEVQRFLEAILWSAVVWFLSPAVTILWIGNVRDGNAVVSVDMTWRMLERS